MASVHGYPDLSFKAGTGCNSTGAAYRPVYISGDNTVSICNTTTTLAKFVGITQGYVNNVGDAIAVRVAGPSKAVLCASITAAVGNAVGIAVNTTTAANGCVLVAASGVANTAAGSDLVIGRFLTAGAAAGDVCEIFINPTFIAGFTSTVVG